MKRLTFVVMAGMVALACSRADKPANDSTAATAAPSATTPAPAATSIAVPMRDSSGHELGTLTVSEAGGGIQVSGTLRGLPPGTHGIHLHMVGSCEPPFTSAGGHWNPTGKQHGSDNPAGPHFGDLKNIEVGKDSTVNVQMTSPGGTLRGADPLLDADDASIVIHAAADDYKTDPSGNSGARMACGIVRAS